MMMMIIKHMSKTGSRVVTFVAVDPNEVPLPNILVVAVDCGCGCDKDEGDGDGDDDDDDGF